MNNKYNLEDRTSSFSKSLILFLKRMHKSPVDLPLIDQCLRSGTSIGANYREANGASSKKDFGNKTYVCKKEAKETMYWLELIGGSIDNPSMKEDCRKLWSEAKELTLIFSKIANNSRVLKF